MPTTPKRKAHRPAAIAFVLAFLTAQLAGTLTAQAAWDDGQSTRYSDQIIIFCGQWLVRHRNVEQS